MKKPIERITHYSESRPAQENEPVDELVMFNAYVHLEAMDNSVYSLIVTTNKETVCLMIEPKRGKPHVRARVFWRETLKQKKSGVERAAASA